MTHEALDTIVRSTLVLIFIFASTCVNQALAVEWRVKSALDLGLVQTDNANLAEPGMEQGATVRQIRPSISLFGRGNRSDLFILSELDYFKSSASEDHTVYPKVYGSLNSTIVDRKLFLNSSILVNRVLVSTDAGPIDSLDLGGVFSTTTNINVVPRLELDLGRSTELQLQYGLNTYIASDDQLSDSNGNSVSAELNYDAPSGGYSLGASTGLSRTDFEFGEPLQQRNAAATIGKVLGSDLQFDATVGKEWNQIPDQAGDTASSSTTITESSAIWDVALTWNPGARTSLIAGYGKRTFGERPRLELTHRSRRSDVSLNWSRGITRFNVTLPNGTFVDFPDDSELADIDDVLSVALVDTRISVEEQIQAVYQLRGRKSRLRLESTYTQREFQFQTETAKSSNLTLRSIVVRQLGRKMSLRLSFEHLRGKSLTRYRENRIGVALSLDIR